MENCTNGFTIPELIARKRDGGQLSQDQIEYFIKGVTSGQVQDAQLGAMLMAIFLNDMALSETSCLTRAMMHSGRVFKWPDAWRGTLVDKHSTGGVGDKVSLVLAPALAACGMKVPMISGRGLGHTGGTLDKLESIPGYQVSLSEPEMLRILDEVGCVIAGQTADIVPADRRMYAIRDITGTVANIPLLVGSIMSKKASENIDALVLDIKYGTGAFMKDISGARDAASVLVKCGEDLGISTVAVLTNMNTPIGGTVGNALEVAEAIDTMKGRGSKDLLDLTVQLGAQLLCKTDKSSSLESAHELLTSVISSGTALTKFCDMLKCQGVEPALAEQLCDVNVDCRELLPRSKYSTTLNAPSSGYISSIDAMDCAVVSWRLGAGRSKSGDHIDHAVGLELLKHVGEFVNQDEPWIRVHHNTENLTSDLRSSLFTSLKLTSSEIMKSSSRVKEVITKNDS